MSLYGTSKARSIGARPRTSGRGDLIADPITSAIVERIEAIDPFFASAIGDHPVESEIVSVPFWQKTRVCTVAARMSFRRMDRSYADDGENLTVLTRPDAFYAINARENVKLDRETVGAYVRFFVKHTGVGRGARIIEDTVEARLIDEKWLTDEQIAKRKDIERSIRAIAITQDGDRYNVIAHAVRGTDLVELAIQVTSGGIVEAVTTVVLMDQIPVVA